MRELTLIKTALLLRREVEAVFPELKGVSITIRLGGKPKASLLKEKEVVITLPPTFRGREVEGKLLLGLATHELAHALLTPFEELRRERKRLERRNHPLLEHIRVVAGWLEDARIESLLPEPFASFLVSPREASKQPFPKTSYHLYHLLHAVRFSDPLRPFSFPTAGKEKHIKMVVDVVAKVATTVSDAASVYYYATMLVEWARRENLLPPEPPEWEPPCVVANIPILPPEERGDTSPPQVVDPPDQEIIAEGRRLGRRMHEGWSRHLTPLWVGVGRYQPRLDREGTVIPPFTLPIRRKPSPPLRVLILLDTSDSMWVKEEYEKRLRPARVATVAVAEAVRRVRGEVRVIAFCGGWCFCRDEIDAITRRGESTWLDFLPSLAQRFSEWEILIITDAEVSIPAWSESERKRTTIIYISSSTSSHWKEEAKKLGRVIEVGDNIEALPLAVALAARKWRGKRV